MADKQRIIDLQRQVSIARKALERIAHGCRDPDGVAEEALDGMMAKDHPTRRAPLAGVLGWERPPRG